MDCGKLTAKPPQLGNLPPTDLARVKYHKTGEGGICFLITYSILWMFLMNTRFPET